MGLADMMSPGDPKLPLKADGKEDGAPQPESKSKVFPFSSHAVRAPARCAAVLLSVRWCRPAPVPFGFFSSACLHRVHRVYSLLPHPLHGVDLKVTSSYGIELLVVGEGWRDKTHPRDMLRGWGDARVPPAFDTCSHFLCLQFIASCFGRLSSNSILNILLSCLI